MAASIPLRPSSPALRALLALLALALAASAHAASMVVAPALGSTGTSIRIAATGLTPSATYTLEFAGTPITTVATLVATPRGDIDTTRVLPNLPTGNGKMRLRTGTLGGSLVAYTAFTALVPMGFAPAATTIHAGQLIRYRVLNVSSGTLTVLVEGQPVAGPLPVSNPTYTGQFAVPTDRPASFPANARVTLINKVGNAIVNQLQTTMAVQPALAGPLAISITGAPPTQARPGQRFNVSGQVTMAANEAPPEQMSLWYFGDNGEVFPMGAAEFNSANGQLQYDFASAAPGVLSMTAGQSTNGQTAFVTTSTDTYGRPVATTRPPNNATLDQLPEDRWRIRVTVRGPGGVPIPGAIVQISNAPVAEPEPESTTGSSGLGLSPRTGSIGELVLTSTVPSQLSVPATDAQGCPLTLERRVTDQFGVVEFEFEEEELRLTAIGLPVDCTAGGSCNPSNNWKPSVRLAIDASAQGYGFQFTEGPNAFDFLPHIYEVFFNGVDDGDPSNDETVFVDWYQDVEVLVQGRDARFTQSLPPIQPKVALYDTAIVPWQADAERIVVFDGDTGFSTTRLAFGPINSQRGINTNWILPSAQAYPTEITVRTDPAVTGVVDPGNARLYLDANRDGIAEPIGNFTPSNIPLDCTIDGLDKSITWRATLPPNLKLQAGGRIGGYAQFIGEPNSGQVKQYLAIDMVERDLGWLANSRYSNREVRFNNGGQSLNISAVENTEDATIRLDSDPGYDIGRLRNETANTRLIDISVDRNGVETARTPIAGDHEEAGREGDSTVLDFAVGVTYNPDPITLIDNSFPLFYYVWGVPLLAGIEVGANFTILAEIDLYSRVDLSPAKEPVLTLRTTPSLDLGLNFFLDIDVLFDLVDGGVDLDAVFALDMPIEIENGVVQDLQPEFDATLEFSWRFEVFCLPLDVICDAINDIEGCEWLVAPQDNRPCVIEARRRLAAPTGSNRPPSIARLKQSAVAYSPSGAGFLAFTRLGNGDLDPPELVVRPIDGGDYGRVPDETVLSTAPGIRSIAVEFYAPDRAAIVWAESADNYATLATRTPRQRIARQRLMYALWNGETWGLKTALTPVSGGEGGVDLAGCIEDYHEACPAGGALLAVWTRDMAGDIAQHRTRVYSSRYDTARGWTTAQAVDTTALLDSAPSAAYVGGQPVVAFVRSTNGVFADTDARRVAYRVLSAGTMVQVPAALPGGAAWPSIVGTPGGGFAIAHTHATDPRAFVGNTQRAALAFGSACVAGACSIVAQAVTDANGRAIYGERPTALVDDAGNVNVVMRGMGFGVGDTGVNNLPGDPIGMSAHTGELIAFATAQGEATVAPLPLSADGAAHFAPTAAYDPVLGQIVAASTIGIAPSQALRNKLTDAGIEPAPARAAGTPVDTDLMMYGIEQGVDFAIESITADSSTLVAGATLDVAVTVRNVGANHVSVNPAHRVVLSFDSPYEAGGSSLGGRFVPSLRSGESRTLPYTITVPAGFSPDQQHRLYARIFRNNNPVPDVNFANDQRSLDFGGMPMPFGLNASAVAGTRLVQLTWDPIAGAQGLVAGYRIWCHDGDGQWRHLGSSFNLGFLDLSAPVGVERHYRVTSYSAKAIESAPSDEAVAKVTLGDGLFSNGFE